MKLIHATGTPIELEDANTLADFDEHIDIDDIPQAVDDHATVNTINKAWLAKL